MKNSILLITAFFCSITGFAQDDDFKYRRSSLHTMMVNNPQIVIADNFSLPIADITRRSFTDSPFPTKYDNHDISTDQQSYKFLTLTGQDEEEGKEEGNEDKVIGPNGKELSKKDSDNVNQIQDFLKKNKIANKMVGKWFNQTNEGAMDDNLIRERGWNNASEADLEDAKALSKSTNTLIINAGYELIGNTFLVVNQYKFVDNEFVAKPVYQGCLEVAKEIKEEMPRKLAEKLCEKAYQKMQGYTIRTKAYLFQLAWNDSISNIFYNNLYPAWEASAEDLLKTKEAFDNSELFHFEFVGVEKSMNTITSKLDPEKAQSDEQKIQTATARAVDRTYFKLQKNYDVFKPLSALVLGDKPKDCSAKIGMKEGLEGGEKFDVLKPSFNRKTGASEFKKVATITVDKKNVWDNQYIAGQGPTMEGDEIAIQATKFKGCKKNLAEFYPYIRLTK